MYNKLNLQHENNIYYSAISYSQVELPISENGKIAFEGEIILSHLEKDSLSKLIKNWLIEKKYKNITSNEVGNLNEVKAANAFYVYSRGAFSQIVNGHISYNINIQVVDQGYKYSFSDFVFHYYKLNRYLEMERSGRKKRLEDEKAPGWQRLWLNHRMMAKHRIEMQEKDLKSLTEIRTTHLGPDLREFGLKE